MATTREVAIRLVAEVGDFNDSIAEIVTKLRDLGTQAGANATRGFQQMDKAARDYGKTVDELGKQEAATASETTTKIVETSKKGAKERISDAARIKAALGQENEEILHAAIKLDEARRKSHGKTTEAVKEAEAEVYHAQAAFYRKQKELVEKFARERIAATEHGTHEQLRLESEMYEKLARLQQQQTRATTTGLRKEHEIKTEGAEKKLERGENAETISQGLQSGRVAGITSMLGPVGAVAGIVVDQLHEVADVVVDLAKEARETEQSWTKFSFALEKTHPDMTAGEIRNLRVELTALERPLGTTQADIAKLGGEVGRFAKPEQIVAATNAILNLSRAAGEGGPSLDEISSGVARITATTGDAVKAADLLAEAQFQLTAVSKEGGPAALSQAVMQIGSVSAKAAVNMRDAGKAANESAALFTALAQSGYKVKESGAGASAVVEELAKALTDDKLSGKILADLPKGMTLAQAGIEEGNVSTTKFVATLTSMGEAGKKLAADIGGPAGTALGVLVDKSQQGTVSLDKLATSFDHAKGANERMAEASESKAMQQAAKNQARVDDLKTAAGNMFTGALTAAGQAIGGIMDFVVRAGDSIQSVITMVGAIVPAVAPIAAAFSFLRDKLIDMSVEAARSKEEFEKIAEGAKGVRELKESLEEVGKEDGLKAVMAQIGDINEHSPEAGKAIQAIAVAVDMTEPQKLEAINRELALIADSKAAEAIIAADEAMNQAQGAMEQLDRGSKSWLSNITDSLPAWTSVIPLIGAAKGLSELTKNAPIADQLKDAREEAQKMQVSYDQMRASGENTVKAGSELFAKHKEIADLEAQSQKMQDGALTQAKSMVDILEKRAESQGKEFDKAGALAEAQDAVRDSLKDQPELAEKVAASLAESVNSAHEAEGALKEGADATKEQAVAAGDLAALTKDRADALKDVGVTMDANAEKQLQDRKDLVQANDLVIANLETQLKLLDAALENHKLENDQVKELFDNQKKVNEVLAQRKSALETGKTPDKEVTLTAGSSEGDIQHYRDQVAEELTNLKAANSAVKQEISATEHGFASFKDQVKDGAEGVKALNKAQEDASIAMLEGAEHDRAAAKLTHDHAIEDAKQNQDKIAAANINYATQLGLIAKKEAADKQKSRDDADKKAQAAAEKAAKEAADARKKELDAIRASAEARVAEIEKFRDAVTSATSALKDKFKAATDAAAGALKSYSDDLNKNRLAERGPTAELQATTAADFATQSTAAATASINAEAAHRLDLMRQAKTAADAADAAFQRIQAAGQQAQDVREGRIFDSLKEIDDLYAAGADLSAADVRNATAFRRAADEAAASAENLADISGGTAEGMMKATKDQVTAWKAAELSYNSYAKAIEDGSAYQDQANALVLQQLTRVMTAQKLAKSTTDEATKAQEEYASAVRSGADQETTDRLKAIADQALNTAHQVSQASYQTAHDVNAIVPDSTLWARTTQDIRDLYNGVIGSSNEAAEAMAAQAAAQQKVVEATQALAEAQSKVDKAASQKTRAIQTAQLQHEWGTAADQRLADQNVVDADVAIARAAADVATANQHVEATTVALTAATAHLTDIQNQQAQTGHEVATGMWGEHAAMVNAQAAATSLGESLQPLVAINEVLAEHASQYNDAMTMAKGIMDDATKAAHDRMTATQLLKQAEDDLTETLVLQDQRRAKLQADYDNRVAKAKPNEVVDRSELDKASAALRETGKALDAVTNKATHAKAAMDDLRDSNGKLADSVKAAFEGVNEGIQVGLSFVDSIKKSKDVGDIVNAAADLTQKIGEAMLNASDAIDPTGGIRLAGAFIVGGALMAKAVVAIARLFETPSETAAEKITRQADAEKRINTLLEDRKQIAADLTAAGDIQLDQAREKIALLKQEIALNASKLGQTRLETAALLENADLQKKRWGDIKAAAETAKKLAGDGTFDYEAGKIAELENRFNVSAGTFRGDWTQFLAYLDTQVQGATDAQAALTGQMKNYADLRQDAKDQLAEEIKLLELRKSLGESSLSIAQQEEALRRKSLAGYLTELGDQDAATMAVLRRFNSYALENGQYVVEFAGKTRSEINSIIDALASMPQTQLTADAIEAAQAWLDAGKALDDATAATQELSAASDDLYEKEKTRLDLLHKLGRLTDDEYKAQLKALYEQRIVLLEQEEAQITASGTISELLDKQNERYQVELDLKNLMDGQNASLTTQDDILVGLVRKRQELLESIRAETHGGTLSASQQAQIDAVTAQAVARMKEQGATDQQIADFKASLPKYEVGGMVPQTGPAVLHKGELVIPAHLTEQLRALSWDNTPAARVVTLAANRAAMAALTPQQQAPHVTNIVINLTLPASWTPSEAQTQAPTLGQSIVQQVQRSIQSGQLSLRRN